jgi:hypothetical protein
MEPLYLHAFHARRRACRPRAAALRVAAATPPLNPLCAFRPQGRGALVRPPPAAAVHVLARWRPSVERRRSSRASGSKYSPESRLHRSPYSFAAACRCRRGRRHRHAAAYDRENPGPVFPLRKRSLTLSPKLSRKLRRQLSRQPRRSAPHPSRQASTSSACHAGMLALRERSRLRRVRVGRFAFQARRGGGLENEALRLSPGNRLPRMRYNARSGGG